MLVNMTGAGAGGIGGGIWVCGKGIGYGMRG